TDSNKVFWLNLHGIHDAEPVKEICNNLDIHRLVLEDILDTNQRPKLQEFDHYLQFSIKSILPLNNDLLITEQISFILGKNYLLSFQEKKGDHFEHIRLRLREKKGIVRERSADYLLFLLLEAVLDNYFETVEIVESRTNILLQFDVNSDPHPSTVFDIEKTKSDVLLLKKLIEPIKIAILHLENEPGLISKRHVKYYSELKDQCNQLIDEVNTLYNRLESGINLFFSLQGFKMNQIMKTLTVMATIFIPLTFIVGVYGMNFDVMPELHIPWGYYGVWIVMLAIIGLMVVYFKRKKWF
ncbi:MAG: magnesium/cobalt transporter CorA, partial [Bacteroidales bacterium]|nr:magnesium/cobalt transporter CorA [Bacteroidales bacterium]